MKEEVFKKEMKVLNINVDDIKPSDDLFGAIEKAIIKMQQEFYLKKLEVVLNSNLIEVENKLDGCRTILGCRISYMDLAESISFIVRKDIEPSYEQLQQENKELKENIEALKELDLYTCEEDYDYEENLELNYVPFDIEEFLEGDK